MKILFFCTAHNSLSQRLYLELSSSGHNVSIEYALSDEKMIEAVALFHPDLVLCPFLITRVPQEIYNTILTLIMHPGPPGDAGPSALDWVLLGDDGSTDDAGRLLTELDSKPMRPGRTHWGVTVLQAVEQFDAGPVWAFEQFPVDIDQSGLTKSELYRGPMTRAAINAIRHALTRVQNTAKASRLSSQSSFTPKLKADPLYGQLSVSESLPFQGGKTHHRPLLKAAQRDFDVSRHSFYQISRRIRCADSQPGVLSKVFGPSLFLYEGIVDENLAARHSMPIQGTTTKIIAVRDEAVCICTCDGKGLWITHLRRPKGSNPILFPKVPATSCLGEIGILSAAQTQKLSCSSTCDWSRASYGTFQEIWVDFDVDENFNKTAYLYFKFYNCAMATDQCSRLIEAMNYIISESTAENPLHAVALMGGSYFSNGIALNVIEAAADPAEESWLNINRIDDVVHYILYEFPGHGILTIAAIRGNAAAGGVALAAACDIIIAGSEAFLNPAYRTVGLYGSEYHTLSYYGRCGKARAKKILRAMTPMRPLEAQRIGLIDYIFPGTGEELEDYIRSHIVMLLRPRCPNRGLWKAKVDLSLASLARARATELIEMSKDFWSTRSIRYHDRRFDFVRKVKPVHTPLRFAKHRRPIHAQCFDFEERDDFDDLEYYRKSAEVQLKARLYDEISTSRRSSIVTLPRLETAGLGARKTETMFSCYYKPIDDLPSPPETPLLGATSST